MRMNMMNATFHLIWHFPSLMLKSWGSSAKRLIITVPVRSSSKIIKTRWNQTLAKQTSSSTTSINQAGRLKRKRGWPQAASKRSQTRWATMLRQDIILNICWNQMKSFIRADTWLPQCLEESTDAGMRKLQIRKTSWLKRIGPINRRPRKTKVNATMRILSATFWSRGASSGTSSVPSTPVKIWFRPATSWWQAGSFRTNLIQKKAPAASTSSFQTFKKVGRSTMGTDRLQKSKRKKLHKEKGSGSHARFWTFFIQIKCRADGSLFLVRLHARWQSFGVPADYGPILNSAILPVNTRHAEQPGDEFQSELCIWQEKVPFLTWIKWNIERRQLNS